MDGEKLLDAIENGDLNAFKENFKRELLELRSNNGGTPLMLAAFNEQLEMVKFLLEKGAAVNQKDDFQSTPLMWAAQKGNIAIIELLLSKGAKINSQDEVGTTALIWTALSNKPEATKLLLKKGADPQIKDADGNTAQQVAQRQGNTAIVDILSSTTDSTKSSSSESTEGVNILQKLKGWLILPAINIVGFIIISLKNLITTFDDYGDFPIMNTYLLLSSLFMIALTVWLGYLFYKAKKETPKAYIHWIYILAAVSVIPFIFGIIRFEDLNTESASNMVAMFPSILIYGAVWINYFKKSNRVEEAFTEQTTEPFVKQLNTILKVDTALEKKEQLTNRLRGWLLFFTIMMILTFLQYFSTMHLIGIFMKGGTSFLPAYVYWILDALILAICTLSVIKMFKRHKDAGIYGQTFLYGVAFVQIMISVQMFMTNGYVFHISSILIPLYFLILPLVFTVYLNRSKVAPEILSIESSHPQLKKTIPIIFGILMIFFAGAQLMVQIQKNSSEKNIVLAFKTDDLSKIENVIKTSSANALAIYLPQALTNNCPKIMNALLKKGVSLQFKKMGSDSYLFYALKNKQKEMVKVFIENGSDINSIDKDKNSILHYSALIGDLDLINYVLSKGINPTNINTMGENAIAFSLQPHKFFNPLEFREKKELIDSLYETNNLEQQIGTIELLVSNNLDLAATNNMGENILMYALYFKNTDLFDYLLSKGLDINLVDKSKSTLLQKAIKYKLTNHIEYLKSKGAK